MRIELADLTERSNRDGRESDAFRQRTAQMVQVWYLSLKFHQLKGQTAKGRLPMLFLRKGGVGVGHETMGNLLQRFSMIETDGRGAPGVDDDQLAQLNQKVDRLESMMGEILKRLPPAAAVAPAERQKGRVPPPQPLPPVAESSPATSPSISSRLWRGS